VKEPHGHKPRLRVKEQDSDPTVEGVREIRVPNASVTDEGKGIVSLAYDPAGTGDAEAAAHVLAHAGDDDAHHAVFTAAQHTAIGDGAPHHAAAHVHDAAVVTYTPAVATDWDADADPGDLDDALNQLAERTDDLEAAPPAHVHDASVVTYTPTVATDWDADADPGDANDALDQLAERVDDLEGAAGHTRLHAMTDVLDHSSGNWKVFYSDDGGTVHELALGGDGTVLTSTGAATAPAFEAAAAGGGVSDAAFSF